MGKNAFHLKIICDSCIHAAHVPSSLVLTVVGREYGPFPIVRAVTVNSYA